MNLFKFLFFLFFSSFIASNAFTQAVVKNTPHLSAKPTAPELAKIKSGNIEKAAKTQFQYFIIKADSTTYGYSIYAGGNLYIEQKTIPAIGGTRGFADAATAGKCAQLVIQKIKQGEMPPRITLEDLKKLNVIQ